jgi:type III secretion system FlhB-like substrate exporter
MEQMKQTRQILLLGTLFFALTSPVWALNPGPYLGVFVGGQLLSPAESEDSLGTFNLEYRPAPSASVVLGWELEPGSSIGEGRVELEYSRRSNRLDEAEFSEGKVKGAGDLTVDSLLVNTFGVYRSASRLTPYLGAGAAMVVQALLDLLLQAAAVLLLLGAFDFYRQRRKMDKRLKMTKHEVRQEQRDLEGNPQIKARVRRLQRDMRRRRMIRAVPEATVVVTNPSHYAVALKYDSETMPAPLVLAKGLDFLALRIRAIAEENRIPIVENPPLAQALHRSCEVGSEIPPELYRAVAEILAYIYRLTRRG